MREPRDVIPSYVAGGGEGGRRKNKPIPKSTQKTRHGPPNPLLFRSPSPRKGLAKLIPKRTFEGILEGFNENS